MHQCTHCQAELAANAQFCARCGTPVEASQTSSTEPDLAGVSAEEELETTSKQPAITPPATPALPTLRTRRMHPRSPIPEFTLDPWQPMGTTADEANTLDPSPDTQATLAPELEMPLPAANGTDLDAPQVQEDSAKPESAPLLDTPLAEEESAEPESATLLDTPLTEEEPESATLLDTPLAEGRSVEAAQPDLSTPEAIDTLDLPLAALAEIAAAPGDNPLPALALQTPVLEETSTSSLSNSPLSPVPQTPALEEVPVLPADNLPLSPISQTPAPAEVVASSASTPGNTPIFPPLAPERNSTPRPEVAAPQPILPSLSASKRMRARRNRILLVALIVALVALLGGTGAFVFLRQQNPANTSVPCTSQQAGCTSSPTISLYGKPTNLSFSGAVTGTMSVVAKPACQSASSGDLHTLTVNLSGTINNQLYNFGFLIEHYNGPGTYSNATSSLLLLFDVPGESTTNGWNNSDPTSTGSITVEPGEQTGSLTYTLGGVGTDAKTQIQATGIWTCGK